MQSFLDGFDLQAAVRIPASDRRRLEHVSRYFLRPAIATERLELLDDGNYRYELKRPWSDGTEAFLFEPLELMEKLAALVPIPGQPGPLPRSPGTGLDMARGGGPLP